MNMTETQTVTTVTTNVGSVSIPGGVTALPRKVDGTVDWRAVAMRTPANFYVKREHEEKVAALLGKQPSEVADLSPEEIAKVPDKYLVIRKAGIIELARLRGFSSAIPEVQHVQPDYVVVRTLIAWDPFEGIPAKVSGGVGEAHPQNCTRMGAAYLAATAENRAFSRCVRQFLEIDIVCSDELGGSNVEPEPSSNGGSNGAAKSQIDLTPQGSLARAAQEGTYTFSFEQVKQAAKSRWEEDNAKVTTDPNAKRRIENDPTDWKTWADIPPRDCYTLTQLIQAAKAAKAAKAAAPTTAPVASAASVDTPKKEKSRTAKQAA